MANPNNSKHNSWYKRTNYTPKINTENKVVFNFEISPQNGFYGFNLYFMDEDSIDINAFIAKTKAFQSYIHRNPDSFPRKKILESKSFVVDLLILKSDENFLESWDYFEMEIICKTEESLCCMGLAMHQTFIDEHNYTDEDNKLEYINRLPIFRARIANNEPIVHIKNLKVNSYGKLVSLKGTVMKTGTIKLLCQYMTFSCSYCGGTQVVKQVDGVYGVPSSCPSKGCNAHSNFIPLLSSPYTRTIDWQTLKLQEITGDDLYENGRIPRTLECELTEDLVNCCGPVDDVTVTGIVKVRNTETNKNKQASVFALYLDVVSIVNEKTQTPSGATHSTRISFNTKDYYAIKQIHSEPMLFRLLVQSICPTIFGHEIVKAGLLLALFGGTQNDADIRSDSHVLVVGDPGLGKSQMLQACTNVAPRGVYVCGNSSTGSGLTVTMSKESGGEYSLEAGALVMADQGCCCIDEFDKMPTQHACLLEAMEQQRISIAKAGVLCNLPTRVTVLTAANPAGGHYNKAKTVSENLKIASPVLSRFDLVFILLDQANEKHDLMLSEHIIALHTKHKSNLISSSQLFNNANSSHTQQIPSECITLRDRLKIHRGEIVDYLAHCLFRKYIAYAQKYVHPQLNEGAKHILTTFYLELRKYYQKSDCVPITTRQLQSLVRLTQARAKLELREEATTEDAIDVVEIMRHSLMDVFLDETGRMDFTRSQNGIGMSRQRMATEFIKVLQQKAENLTKSVFTSAELNDLAKQLGVGKDKFSNLIETLNIQGFLLKKGSGKYQLVTV